MFFLVFLSGKETGPRSSGGVEWNEFFVFFGWVACKISMGNKTTTKKVLIHSKNADMRRDANLETLESFVGRQAGRRLLLLI